MSPGISRLSALLDALFGPFKVWYPLQDTAAMLSLNFLENFVSPWNLPCRNLLCRLCIFSPSIPSPQIQRDRCFDSIKAKEVYIIPRNSTVGNILFTFSIAQNAKLYYRKRLKANIQTCKSSFARKPEISKHIHIYGQNIAYKQMSWVLRTAVVQRYGGILICLKLPYGPQNTVNI